MFITYQFKTQCKSTFIALKLQISFYQNSWQNIGERPYVYRQSSIQTWWHELFQPPSMDAFELEYDFVHVRVWRDWVAVAHQYKIGHLVTYLKIQWWPGYAPLVPRQKKITICNVWREYWFWIWIIVARSRRLSQRRDCGWLAQRLWHCKCCLVMLLWVVAVMMYVARPLSCRSCCEDLVVTLGWYILLALCTS